MSSKERSSQENCNFSNCKHPMCLHGAFFYQYLSRVENTAYQGQLNSVLLSYCILLSQPAGFKDETIHISQP